MKKLLALLLAGIMIFALVGCNNAEVSEDADNSGYSEELDEAEDVVNKINMTSAMTKQRLHCISLMVHPFQLMQRMPKMQATL